MVNIAESKTLPAKIMIVIVIVIMSNFMVLERTKNMRQECHANSF